MIDYVPKGWFKFHRKLELLGVLQDSDTLRLYIYLVCRAVTEPIVYCGITIERGQVVTTFRELSEKLNFSMRRVRTLICRLKASNLLTQQSTRKATKPFSIITISDYDSYQGNSHAKRQTERQSDRQCNRQKAEGHTFNNRKEEFIEKKDTKDISSTPSNELEEVLIEKILNEMQWREGVMKSFSLDETSFVKRLDEFLASNRNRGKLHKDLPDLKAHFVDWLKIVLNSKSSKSQSNENTETGRRNKRRGMDAGVHSAEEFEGPF